MFLLNKAYLVFMDKYGCIIEVFNIILFLSFRVIAGLVDKIFNNEPLLFLTVCLLNRWLISNDMRMLMLLSTNMDGVCSEHRRWKRLLANKSTSSSWIIEKTGWILQLLSTSIIYVKHCTLVGIWNRLTYCYMSFFITLIKNWIK